eukprot:TRINITY_DN18_c0_g1_i7.p1 TRINITY_DN18_c0_g1~~TRINITY_DN18_c0_g1_i7.p1  ORF type:complete len:836 (-),score=207.16 TRINITY_DN18_c0_g1_i7:132-2639(-)
MKCALFVCLALACLLAVQAQQNVIVNVYTYFDAFAGGSGRVACRPTSERTFGGPTNQTACSAPNPPRSQARWGTPYGNNVEKSGVGFEGVLDKTVSVNQDFYLGNLVHFNFPIVGGTAATSVYLNVIFVLKTVGNQPIGNPITYRYQLLIDETVNETPCAYASTSGNPCADRISFGNTVNPDINFQIGEVDYTLQLRGFKESSVSTSNPIADFISQEKQSSQGYLFARIIASCPTTCLNGANYVINAANQCICNCTTASPCSASNPPKVYNPDCSCSCPNPNQCQNGGTLNPSTCQCSCPANACTSPKVASAFDCSCACPENYCNSGNISNPNTCGCQCPSTCNIPNEIRDARCNCVCNLNCGSGKVEDPSSSVCGCICASQTCSPGYTKNQTTCNCDCTKTCVNAPLVVNTCSCGTCVGNWTKDGNGNCTICGITQGNCRPGEVLDAASCRCVCNQVNCNLQQDGLVIDETACGCRPCRAGECYCGNNIVEVGEQCDKVGDPCCQNCRNTTAPCNDGNLCTEDDVCNGAGVCRGEYKCLPSTECATITCNSANGQCVTTNKPEGTGCGALPYDLCARRCVAGTCANFPTECPADNDLDDCQIPVCLPATGLCPYRNTSAGSSCSDGNYCTTNDYCTASGVCQGSARICDPTGNPCLEAICDQNVCTTRNVDDVPCDDLDACTVGDTCVSGKCNPGKPTTCPDSSTCRKFFCNSETGRCDTNDLNGLVCDDRNACTLNDTCTNGMCSGIRDEDSENTVCNPVTPANTTALVFGLVGAGAALFAIAGIAYLIKKIRASKLLDPETWDPSKFSSVGSNPLYKGSEMTVDNRMYEGTA